MKQAYPYDTKEMLLLEEIPPYTDAQYILLCVVRALKDLRALTLLDLPQTCIREVLARVVEGFFSEVKRCGLVTCLESTRD